MDSVGLTLTEIFYLVFGGVGLLSTVVALLSGSRKRSGDERERLVRIDENVRGLRDEVADLKSEMRSANTTLQDHERRLVRLEIGAGAD